MKQLLHLKAPGNWLNDPNGFLYYRGQYHLFYQYNPEAPVWGNIHWGHAVSSDLIHWEHKGIALHPSHEGDRNGCFSGCAVEHDGKMHLFYTGIRFRGADISEGITACQMHFVSEDGETFDQVKGKEIAVPVITDPSIADPAETRDPKVWRAEDGRWMMVLGTTKNRKEGRLAFFESTDLSHWQAVGTATLPLKLGWMWECPDLFRAGDGDVLLISAMNYLDDDVREPNQTLCIPVTFEETTCRLAMDGVVGLMDWGMDLYAPQSTLDEEGRRIVTAWLRMPEAVDDTNGRWNGMLCLPRVAERRGNHIYFRMHPYIRHAFLEGGEKHEEPNPAFSMAPPAKTLLVMHLKNGMEADLFGLHLKREGDRLIADRSRVYPPGDGAMLRLQTPVITEGDLLEIVIDPNLIECYINDGEYVLSLAVYDLQGGITIPRGSDPTWYVLS